MALCERAAEGRKARESVPGAIAPTPLSRLPQIGSRRFASAGFRPRFAP